jgi:MGT family glycosyltransferase
MAMAASVSAVNHVRADLDLPPVARLGDLLAHVAHVIVTAPAAIDTPPDPLPANVTYVGPVFEDGTDVEWTPPAGHGPLVVVSLGTTDMDELPLLARVLGALAHVEARILATVGDHADPWEIPTPGNATVSRFVQHAAVLPHADLVISHGGIGTCLAALAHGLPVLCIPLGRDQPVNAAALARTGAAKVLASTASPKQIAVAVDELLREPSYRQAAQQMASSLPRPGDRHPATTLIAGMLD